MQLATTLAANRDGVATICSIMSVYNIGACSGPTMKVRCCTPADRERHLLGTGGPMTNTGDPLAEIGGLLPDTGGPPFDMGDRLAHKGGL